MRLHLLILLMLFLMINTAAQADVIPTSGKYYETTEDIKVKVMGGFLTLQRTWIDGQWHFNRHWNRLRIVRNLEDNSIKEIDRNGDIYVKVDDAGKLFRFGKKETIAVTESGYRWQDRKGNWINFDSEGYFLKYGDRNNVAVTLQYDEQKRVSGVLDHFNEQMLWYSYNDQNQLSEIHDYTQRKVRYAYTGEKLTSVFDLRGNEWKYAYSGNNLISKTDPENHATQFSYNANNQLIKIEDEIGVWREYGYDYDKTKDEFYFREQDGVGKVTESWYQKDGQMKQQALNGNAVFSMKEDGVNKIRSDGLGNETKYEYDEWGNILKITYPDQAMKKYEYDAIYSNVTKEVNENGVVTSYQYDESGNLINIVEAVGSELERKTEYYYDEYGNIVKIKNISNELTLESVLNKGYDSYGNIIKIINQDNYVSQFSHDVMGNLLTKNDAYGNKWINSYDDSGSVLSYVDPLSYETKYFYDNSGNNIEIKNAEGDSVFYLYDARNKVICRKHDNVHCYKYRYDNEGNITEEIDEDGIVVRKVKYDINGNVELIKKGNKFIEHKYNEIGLLSSRTEMGAVEDFFYDNRNRIIKVSRRDLTNFVYSQFYKYDKRGSLIERIDENGSTVQYVYDALGRRIYMTDSLGGSVRFGFDSRNNIISTTNALNNKWIFHYDRSDRLLSRTDPMGRVSYYKYNSVGNMIQFQKADGKLVLYIYDATNRLINIKYYKDSGVQLEKSVEFSYDKIGNLISYNDGIVSASYGYDNRQRKLIEIVDYGEFVKFYKNEYSYNGFKKSFSTSDGGLYEYNYDVNGLLISISSSDMGVIAIEPGVDDLNASRITFPNGVSIVKKYDNYNRVNSIVSMIDSDKKIIDHVYEYDVMGRIVKKKTEHGEYLYSYDKVGNLVYATNPVFDDEAYTYDQNKNMITSSKVEGVIGYNANDQLTKFASNKFDYDLNGNLIKEYSDLGNGVSYIWASDNFLKEVIVGDSFTKYYYDPFGRRLWKDTDGEKTYYFYNDDGLISVIDSKGMLEVNYGYVPYIKYTGSPLFYTINNDYFFNINDYLGVTQKSINMAGDVVWDPRYSSFGELLSSKHPFGSLHRFPGQVFDEETGLHYNIHRYYSPRYGRYISEDPIGLNSGFNLYSYSDNDPINSIDPFGLAKICKRMLYNKGSTDANTILADGVSGAFTCILPITSSIADAVNLQYVHEHIFFQDSCSPPNIGYGPGGLYTETQWYDTYDCIEGYDDCILREAVKRTPAPPCYSATSSENGCANCQDWVTRVLEQYQELINDPSIKQKCKCGSGCS